MVRLLNNHFTFYISYLGMNYSNVIGFLLFLVFILQFISGLLLSCYYSPFSTMAFDSVYYIMIDVNVGWLIRWLHCLGASLFMLFILIHWIRGAWIRLKVIELSFNPSFIIFLVFYRFFIFFSLIYYWIYAILIVFHFGSLCLVVLFIILVFFPFDSFVEDYNKLIASLLLIHCSRIDLEWNVEWSMFALKMAFHQYFRSWRTM